jgi:hypothetical protein
MKKGFASGLSFLFGERQVGESGCGLLVSRCWKLPVGCLDLRG